jgi:hypothetical protein
MAITKKEMEEFATMLGYWEYAVEVGLEPKTSEDFIRKIKQDIMNIIEDSNPRFNFKIFNEKVKQSKLDNLY